MDLRSYLRLLARRWPVLLFTTLIVGALLGGGSFFIPSVYSATVQMSLTATGSVTATPDERRLQTDYVVTRLPTFAQVVPTAAVLEPVRERLDLDMTLKQLRDAITVTIPSETTILNITVESGSGAGAADIANAIARELPAAIADVEQAPSARTSPVTVSVLQVAHVPENRSAPNVKLNLAVAAVLALVAGVLAAVVYETLDNRVRRGRDVTAIGAAYLGGIRVVRDLNTKERAVYAKQSPEVQAQYRRIAVDVLFGAGQAPVAILITSAGSGAGKTTLAANLAGALAEAGNRVLYIDADVRGGRLGVLIGTPTTHGLTDVFTGRAEIDDALYAWRDSGITLMPAGASAVNVTEALASTAATTLLDRLRDLFDVIIVDAPPIMSPSDAARLTQNFSNIVVVAEANETKRADLARVHTALRNNGANVIGAVLTRVTVSEDPSLPDATNEDGSEQEQPLPAGSES